MGAGRFTYAPFMLDTIQRLDRMIELRNCRLEKVG